MLLKMITTVGPVIVKVIKVSLFIQLEVEKTLDLFNDLLVIPLSSVLLCHNGIAQFAAQPIWFVGGCGAHHSLSIFEQLHQILDVLLHLGGLYHTCETPQPRAHCQSSHPHESAWCWGATCDLHALHDDGDDHGHDDENGPSLFDLLRTQV